MNNTTGNERLWPVELAPGVKKKNQIGFYYVAFASIAMFVAVNTIAPHLLVQHLGLPSTERGNAAGTLVFWAEVVMMVSIGAYGVLSDKIGRRIVYCFGFLIMGTAFLLSPFATSLGMLTVFRALFGLGSAAAAGMLTTVAADYVVNNDRGKCNAVMGVFNGLGALLAAIVFTRLPTWLQKAGMEPIDAGIGTYSILAGFAFLSVVLAWLLLDPRKPQEVEDRVSFFQLFKEGLAAAKEPGVALSYGTAFISRGDNAVLGTFLVLWVTEYLNDPVGGQGAGGKVMGIAQGAALLSAPLFGVLCDRINRVTALKITLVVASAGYIGTYFIGDPTNALGLIILCVVGIGHLGVLIASQVLIQEQAPPHIRGSVIGFFSLCGALGILVSVKVGGILFDSTMGDGSRFFSGPFVFIGLLNLAVLLWAFIVAKKVKTPSFNK